MKENAIIDNLEFQVKARNDRIINLENEIKELKIKNKTYWQENKKLKEKIIKQNRTLTFATAYAYDEEESRIESSIYGNSNKDLRIKLKNREQKIRTLEQIILNLKSDLKKYKDEEKENE